MNNKDPEVAIPENEQAAVEMVAEDSNGELTEEEKNLIVAQARLIGDL